MTPDDLLLDDAIGWHARLASPQATERDWAEFTNWLDADPDNGIAYDRVALADAAYAEALDTFPPPSLSVAQNDNEPQPWYRRKTLLAVAGGLALALIASPIVLTNRDLQTYETGAGETREIALGDGSSVALNGSSRIEVDIKGGRYARLAEGEALFSIRHEPSRPFTVEVGDHRLIDVGTEFNVRQGSEGLEVAVSDGAVEFNPDNEAVLVRAGSQINVAGKAAKPVLSKTDPASVGGWRQGRLAYSNAPISRIADDLTRLLGRPVVADAKVASRRFSGLIQIERDRDQSMRRIESLLGVRVRREQNGWVLSD